LSLRLADVGGGLRRIELRIFVSFGVQEAIKQPCG
jgi:hypothetical protein